MAGAEPAGTREPLRVLLLEDNSADAELEIWQMRRDGFDPEWERVERLEDFAKRLRPELDVILADYRLPGFDAPSALQVLQRTGLAIPFIVISGAIGEEQAVDCIRHGAADYLFKDRLARLGQAIRLAMEERRLRDEKRWTEEEKRDSEERARLALEAGCMGVEQLDVRSLTITLDPMARKLFRLSSSDERVSAERLLNCIHPADRARVQKEIRDSLRMDEAFEIEFRTVDVDDDEKWFVTRGRVIRDDGGTPSRVLAVTIEITQRKRAEQEIARARDAAEAANRAKDEFLAALSHELRTPLNPVLLLASEKENSPSVPEELRADFGFLRQHVELEARLIDDLLDLSRIAAGRLNITEKTLDLHDVLRKSTEIVRGNIEEKQIRLSFDWRAEKRWVRGDPVRLQQVFWNLLTNSVKFTPANGAVDVLAYNDADAKALILEFRDTGIGMTSEELSRAFQTFVGKTGVRGSDGGHRFGGLGIGLSICKALIEMHHGRISATSAGRGKGAVFRVELPVAPAEAIPPGVPGAVNRTAGAAIGRRLTILLVEDHEPTRSTLARILSRRGHYIIEADSVSAAKQAVEQRKFDVLLSDIGLPDGSGYNLLAELRAHGDMTPAVALSGYGMESDVERSLECGFSTHLTKPVEIQGLERAIANTMNRPSARTCEAKA